jgi:hypothetical protein
MGKAITALGAVGAVGAVALVLHRWPWAWLIAGPVVLFAAWVAVRLAMRRGAAKVDEFRNAVTPDSASERTVRRRHNRTNRHAGQASRRDIRRTAGAAATRRQADVIRPGLTRMPDRRRARLAATEVGAKLCRVGRETLYATHELVVLYLAGPRMGKSSWLAGSIIDHPGSVLVTSTRDDLYQATAHHRETTGPVWMFNAAGISNIPHQVTFNPLTGCERPEAARERADDMIPAGTGEREDWVIKARGALAAMMHAAALGGHTMDDVNRWVAEPAAHLETIVTVLAKSPNPASMTQALRFLRTNDRTQSSITASMEPALEWLQYDVARAAAGLGDTSAPPLDPNRLIDSTATLYIVGRLEDGCEALLSALTGFVARAARRAASRRGGRLDPPLGLMLDEAYNYRPPLAEWTTDMGGSGIAIRACFQSRAQMIDVYGPDKAGVIMNNSGAVMVGGGTMDPDDLGALSTLVGTRTGLTRTRDKDGKVASGTDLPIPVLSASEMAFMPAFQVLLFRSGMPPVVGRIQPVWERWDLTLLPAAHSLLDRWEQRHLHRTSPTPEPTTLPTREEVGVDAHAA